MKTKLISLLLIGAALTCGAQDKALLETLVKKGTLTQQEAADLAKQSVVVTSCKKDTKAVTIGGGVSGWYTWTQDKIRTDAKGRSINKGFTLRYVKLGLKADVGNGWSATVATDFGTEGSARNYLDKVVISKQINFHSVNGTLDMGLRKVNMGQEQNMCDFDQLAIERSIATWTFTRPAYARTIDGMVFTPGVKNFGSRALGIFWDGTIEEVEGLYYGLSVTSATTAEGGIYDANNSFGAVNSGLSFYVNMGYKNKIDLEGDSIAYDFGLNYGYANNGFDTKGFGTGKDLGGSMWGINPYASIKWRGLTAMAEYFLQQVQAGRYDMLATGDNRPTATPTGFTLTAAYKFDLGEYGAIEPVARWSHVSSNGMGLSDGNGVFIPANSGQAIYIGANWYIVPAVKFSVGYEWTQYDDHIMTSASPNEALLYDQNWIRAQMQIVF